MPAHPTSLPLLGLAEELSGVETIVGDPATEDFLRRLLDRVVDAVVDVAQGRSTLSRAHPPPVPPSVPAQERPAASDAVDRAACSALAARCHHLAARLGRHPDQQLAAPVAACLTTVAGALQRLVQDLHDPRVSAPEARQQLRRTLGRAAAMLDALAP